MPPCSVPGCERAAISRGWCNRHYHRWLRGGSAEGIQALRTDHRIVCSVGLCGRWADARGLCKAHHKRWLRGAVIDTPIRAYGVKSCTVRGCDRPHFCRGLCQGHYSRSKRIGRVLPNCPLQPRPRYRAEVEYDSAGDPVRGRLVRVG